MRATDVRLMIDNWSEHRIDEPDRLVVVALLGGSAADLGVLRVEQWFSDGATALVGQRALTVAEGARIADLVCALSVTAVGAGLTGCDGELFTLSVESGAPHGITLTWWVDPPASWLGAAELAFHLRGLAVTVTCDEHVSSAGHP
jgi:sulfur carrier protein ThiS